jgi:hypothetical protein
MNVVSSIDFAGALDVGVCGHRFLDEATHLFLVSSMAFNGFDDEAVCRTARLSSE